MKESIKPIVMQIIFYIIYKHSRDVAVANKKKKKIIVRRPHSLNGVYIAIWPQFIKEKKKKTITY